MTADVIVVTWRAREMTLRCLEHLAAQTVPCRVIVVDNASGDGTPDAVRAAFGDVTVLELPENRGVGAAVNAGTALGDGDAIVLVNNDAFCEPGFVAAMLAPFEDDASVGMVAGMSLMPDGEHVDGFGIEVDPTLNAYNRLRHRRPDERPGVLAGPSGGVAAYRRAAFDAAGGFDRRLFAYAEDLDLALRLRAAGWRAAAALDARAVHLGGASFGIDSPLQRWHAGFGRGFVLRRFGVLRSGAAPRALLFEAFVCGWGAVRLRTLVPVRARVAGWRAAGRGFVRVPAGAVDERITLRDAIGRLAERARGG
jgi:GT2 family glycosyltransferase